MDSRTFNYYQGHASEAVARHLQSDPTAWRDRFRQAFPAGARVVDIGSGSGRDLALLLEMGYDAFGFEPSDAMRAEAVRAFPQLAGRLQPHPLPLPEGSHLPPEGFDGILCSAVLMHLPAGELFDAAFSLRRLLRPGGRLLVSIPAAARPGLDSESRDEGGRLFHTLFPEELLTLLERLGFRLKERWEEGDSLARAGVRWSTLLLELSASGATRPLERIERVLNDDRKTATYKLALFRALSEIGTREHHRALWISNDEVAVPIDAIAEKWLRYYWPLFEPADRDGFIPQNQGEKPGSAKPIAFRRQLTTLIRSYHGPNGLFLFLADVAAGRLREGVDTLYRDTLGTLRRAIKEGPVVYASGNMFRYDPQGRSVVIQASAWREFCELGHWIESAVILRWAEETERMSAGAIGAGRVLELLVSDPGGERRATDEARSVYDTLAPKECVWTGRGLRESYVVDHLIPFSLWRCNDLWNLLPCDPRVNGAKSDRLPGRELLLRRREVIIGYWERMRGVHPRRFDRELVRFQRPGGGGGADWRTTAFRSLSESIELIALQRGTERWEV